MFQVFTSICPQRGRARLDALRGRALGRVPGVRREGVAERQAGQAGAAHEGAGQGEFHVAQYVAI